MFMFFRYWRWKKMARKTILDGRTAQCAVCDDLIVPGDFVGIGTVQGEEKPMLVHAGFHFTLKERDAFCETGAIGMGFWDGTQVVGLGESLASKVMRTGETQRAQY